MRSPYRLTNKECRQLLRQRAGDQLVDKLTALHGLTGRGRANITAHCLQSAAGAAATLSRLLAAQSADEERAWGLALEKGDDPTAAAAALRAAWAKEWAAKDITNPVKTGLEQNPGSAPQGYAQRLELLAGVRNMSSNLYRWVTAYCGAQPDPVCTATALWDRAQRHEQEWNNKDWHEQGSLLRWWEYAIKHQLNPLDPPRYHQDYLKALGPDPAAAAAFERGWDLLDEELRVDMRRTEGLGTKIVAQICVMCATSPDPAGLVGTILAAESPRSKFHQMHKATEGERAAMILSAEEITAIWQARTAASSEEYRRREEERRNSPEYKREQKEHARRMAEFRAAEEAIWRGIEQRHAEEAEAEQAGLRRSAAARGMRVVPA
jgi:hypothetical protein